MSPSDLAQVARSHTLGDIPRRTAQRFPDKLALVNKDVRLTFSELDTLVDRAAAGLASQGVSHGDRIALLSHNCWQYVVLSFASARLGAVLVPINFMLGSEEIAFILDHSGATLLIAEDALVPVAVEAISASAGTVSTTAFIGLGGGPAPHGWQDVGGWLEHEPTPPQVPVADDDPLRLMYTSGTESRPKGALLSSRSLLWQYVSCVIDGGMTHDDVELHTLPLYHCAQLDCFLGPDLYLGATSIVLPSPNPSEILHTIETEGVTKFFAPPTVWIALLRAPEFPATNLSSLRKGYYGASAMPVEVLAEIRDRLPDVRLWNFYGQTEMAPVATILGPDEQLSHAGSAGRPVLNVETRIVDDHDQPLPPTVVGEIVHRSPQATLGYYKSPEKTAEAFRGGWFHSGDLGYLDNDGRLTVVDRKKDMIKTGGENVASREVEEAIYTHPAVAEVAVFGLPDETWVEAVTAAVVAKEGEVLTEEAVIAQVRAKLAGYKAPKAVFLVNALPKNPSGKILKRELREHFTNQR